jgi:hypothetical protein
MLSRVRRLLLGATIAPTASPSNRHKIVAFLR